MRCTDPRNVGFQSDGKTLSWSQKQSSKEYATFQLPCGQCLSCRLEYARQWAVRCVHEAEMHPENSFITLTYSDENLKSPKLVYKDFQDFVKRLRFHIEEKTHGQQKIGYFVTGEYGDKRKRPHWHALIFNWEPPDKIHKYTNHRGDKVYSSETLSTLWGNGIAEFGSVTLESAGYCARYAAKKLIHGRDQEHEFHPISKKSSRHAIGKKYVEKHFKSIFNLGFLVLDGEKLSIPRYYEKWLKANEPATWAAYITNKKAAITQAAKEKNDKTIAQEAEINWTRRPFTGPRVSQSEAKKKILKSKFKQLQAQLKL